MRITPPPLDEDIETSMVIVPPSEDESVETAMGITPPPGVMEAMQDIVEAMKAEGIPLPPEAMEEAGITP